MFEDSGTGWQFTTDVAFPLGVVENVYLGGGYTLLNRDFDGDGDLTSESGGGVFVGLLSDARRRGMRPGLEARWSFVDGETPFRLILSFNFPVGGS